jgi:hypothetical protein
MPVKLFNSPGYVVLTDAESISGMYADLKSAGYDFTVGSELEKTNRLENEGGASIHRPLTYQDFDRNFTEIYPVGSIYMNAIDPREPDKILGFGRWKRIPSGHSLFNVAQSTLDQSNLRNKILSCSVSNNVVTLKIKPLATETVRDNLRIRDFNANNYRFESLVVGQKINITGLIAPADGGIAPNGVHTITNIMSEQYNQLPIDGIYSNETIESSTYDENIIQFSFTTDYNGDYFHLGFSDGQEDNAYFTTLNDIEGLLTAGESERFNAADSEGGFNGFDSALNIQHFPPHNHDRLNGNIKMFKGFTGATGKYHKWDSGGAYDDADYAWHLGYGYGNKKIPSGTSTSITKFGGTSITSAGTSDTIPHENRQPFIAVHMWKRIPDAG